MCVGKRYNISIWRKGRRLRVAGCVQMEPPSSGLEASEQLTVPPAIKVRSLAGGDAVSVLEKKIQT